MKIVKVVAAIIIKDGKILATQRGYGEQKGGFEFPGGKIEAGETESMALIREIKEELTIEIKVKDFFCKIEYDYPNFHLSMACYFCSINKGHIILKEHQSLKWLLPSELSTVNWLPADQTIITDLEQYFKK